MSDIWPPFHETLPLGLGPAELPSAASPQPPRIQPSVLLVDDDSFMLGMQSRMLRSMGYPMIGTAGSGEAALALLRQDPQAVDVVLCDLNMPGMDGIEFLQRLNKRAFRGSVILLSGEGARIMHTVQRLLANGQLVILGALEKPASRVALRALLDCWKPPTAPAVVADEPVFTVPDVQAANRAGQWVLHYQPKVDLKTGSLVGMEALVRWNHPTHGLIYPDRFIGIAEECGAIDALTDWVLREALGQLARWRQGGLALHMAVNVSMENLLSSDFAQRVGAMVSNSRSTPHELTLEITESRLMSPSLFPSRIWCACACSGSACRSTTSAPGIRRLPNCATCPSPS